jgi:hypothetical protein
MVVREGNFSGTIGGAGEFTTGTGTLAERRQHLLRWHHGVFPAA